MEAKLHAETIFLQWQMSFVLRVAFEFVPTYLGATAGIARKDSISLRPCLSLAALDSFNF